MLWRKRIKRLGVCFLCGLCILIARLVQIQLVSTESYSTHHINLIEQSVNQRMQSIMLDDGRGKFFDRNGEPLNHEQVHTVILFPFLKQMTWPVEEVAAILNVPTSQLKTEVNKAEEPFSLERDGEPMELSKSAMEAINALKIPGVFAATINKPKKELVAEQLIGGLNTAQAVKGDAYEAENLAPNDIIGDRGLQQQLDAYLRSQGESKLVYHVDGMGGPLFGINVKYLSPGNALYPVKVNTTLDLDLQQAAEEVADQTQIEKGGMIVLDIQKSEIVASVSRPRENERDPYLNDGAKNHMLTQATIGSVFKTVIAAAAIEEGILDENQLYNCDLTINGSTEKTRPLGMLNFSDSFAQSCNRTFAELGRALSSQDSSLMEEYAEKLQLIGQSGWKGQVYHSPLVQLYQEEKGRVWKEGVDATDLNYVAQTAIGQKDVQVTPLAMANMMATIARNGERQMITAVRDIKFANGTTAANFKNQQIEGETISPATAKRLQQLLKGVVDHGTAESLKQLPVTVAGKTGTAQTNVEKKKVNTWFAGYFPADKPQYAFAVVKLDVTANEQSAASVFGEFVNKIYSEGYIQ